MVALDIMRGAVEFDDELALEAEEIDRVAEQRDLPTEREAVEAVGADQVPKRLLGVGRSGAQKSCEAGALSSCEGRCHHSNARRTLLPDGRRAGMRACR